MKKILRYAFVFLSTICLSNIAKSQSDKLAYTVTDSVQNGVKWNYLRKIDLRTGAFNGILLRLLNTNDTVANSSLYNGVAAIALDEKNKRLYFTPMLTDHLSYVDLKTMRTHIVTNSFTRLFPKSADQRDIFTRMVIADDDNGYALTNDGKHLVRFNVKNNGIKDLGSLVNAPNNEVSVHEICSSYGGDMIAADDDLLYLITSRNHVFKINIETKIAKYMGTITGLPESFTTSGAAVDYRSNRVVVGSALNASDIYSVDFKTLAAVGLSSVNPWYLSDLANSNMLKKKKEKEHEHGIFVNANNNSDNEAIQLYPNPVITNDFKIQFTKTEAGSYSIHVWNVVGRIVTTQVETLSGKNNIVTIKLPEFTSKGIYIVRITNKNNKTVFSEKIIKL